MQVSSEMACSKHLRDDIFSNCLRATYGDVILFEKNITVMPIYATLDGFEFKN